MSRTTKGVKHGCRKREQEAEKVLDALYSQIQDKLPEEPTFGDCGDCGGSECVVVRSGGMRLLCHCCNRQMWLEEPTTIPPTLVLTFGPQE